MSKPDNVMQNYYQPFLVGGKLNNTVSEVTQSVLEQQYMFVLTELSVNRFKWLGLPTSIDERFLEMTLFRTGLSVFFRDDRYGLLALQGAGSGPLNMYWTPTRFTVVGNSEFSSRELTAMTETTIDADPDTGEIDTTGKGVGIWANATKHPPQLTALLYSKRLAAADMTVDIAMRNARRSRVIVADETERLSATNINNAIDRADSFIPVSTSGYDLASKITAIDMGVHPDHVIKLMEARQKLWNEAMGMLGLNYANQDKRERMVVDEVSANDEQVDSMKHVNLNERKRACRIINRKYGLDIDVKYRVDLPDMPFGTGGEL